MANNKCIYEQSDNIYVKMGQISKKKYTFLACALVVFAIYNFFGVGDYVKTRSFDNFDYPLQVDLKPIIEAVLSGQEPAVKPINYYPYKFLTNSGKCNTVGKVDLFIIVKSAMKNFKQRDGIRKTYGQDNYLPNKIVKTLFFLGIDEAHPKSNTQKLIEKEMEEHKDIIQINFHDSYFNNTIKTMMSFRWIYEHCSTADFYLFTDDDMYISAGNALRYADKAISESNKVSTEIDNKIAVNPEMAPTLNVEANMAYNNHLLAGFLFKSTPQRFKTSKWHVSLKEYPWDRWPPYVTAGAYIVSNKSMKFIYIGSFFTKHFRFDDIYLGIVAKKVGIVPIHCPHIYFYKKKYTKEGYKDVIASHGFADSEELMQVWNEQNLIK